MVSTSSGVFVQNGFVQLIERGKLLGIDQLEFVDKEQEMAVARVEMCLQAQGADLGKVMVVDVRVDAEQTSEDRFDRGLEVGRERNTC